jgi:hypothetical protein
MSSKPALTASVTKQSVIWTVRYEWAAQILRIRELGSLDNELKMTDTLLNDIGMLVGPSYISLVEEHLEAQDGNLAVVQVCRQDFEADIDLKTFKAACQRLESFTNGIRIC